MKILSAERVKRADAEAQSRLGIPGLLLMENAAQAVVRYLECWATDLLRKRIVVVTGKGNNGGDGLAVARILHSYGASVEIVLLTGPEDLKGDARQNMDMVRSIGVPIHIMAGVPVSDWPESWAYRDVLLDSILGTGTRGPVTGPTADVIDWINRKFKGHVVSIDLPSGLEADSAEPLGPSVKANATVTFTALKLCHVALPSSTGCGEIWVAPIGVPDSLLPQDASSLQVITRQRLHPVFQPREASAHKGHFGHIFLLAGSRGKSGAASMSGLAAMRSGAGLVTVGVPQGIQAITAGYSPEYMTEGLPEGVDGTFTAEVADIILSKTSSIDVLAIGPGLGTSSGVVQGLKKILEHWPLPLVLDADALNCMVAFHLKIPFREGRPVVLTPHPGEMARLAGTSIDEIQADRIAAARNVAAKGGFYVILKGARTVIACPTGKTYLNVTGNPGMATGGSGDVLTGMVASLLAQQLLSSESWNRADKIESALQAAVYWHGLAGDRFASVYGQTPLIAGDLIGHLAATFPLLTKNVPFYPGGMRRLFPETC